MEALLIRRLNECDADDVASLVRRNALEVNIKDYPEDAMIKLAQSYTAEKILNIARFAHSYVACMGDLIVGCGSIAGFWDSQEESILLTIFVLPEFHGKGIGKEIIRTLEQDEYALRAKRIEIPSSITACEFYRKLGYDYKDGIKKLDEESLYRLEKLR